MSKVNEAGTDGGEDEKLDFAMAGYSMKLNYNRMLAQTAPRVMPPQLAGTGATVTANRKGKRNKVYCILWASGDLIKDPDHDRDILVPFGTDGMPMIQSVRKTLLAAGKDGTCVKYLSRFGRLEEDLRVFDLPNIGFKLLCLPDPRPQSVLKSTESRINIPLANDDNRMACTLLLAENDFDLSTIKDIFGPVLIIIRPSPHPKDFKMKHMQAFCDQYLGLAGGWTGLFNAISNEDNLQALGAAMYQPMPAARRAYKKQLKGKAPPTDLLSHAPDSTSEKANITMAQCGNPKCPSWKTRAVSKDHLQLCSRCEGVYHCSSPCQHEHWSLHKSHCKKIRSKT